MDKSSTFPDKTENSQEKSNNVEPDNCSEKNNVKVLDKTEELLTRGVANIVPSKDNLEKVLKSGKKLNIYLGIDPTAPKIHLGHTVPLRKLQKFVELNHNVTFLIGDFTALIGDTSDKDSERPSLSKQQIEDNFKTYKNQAEKILDFSKVKIVHNSEWLKKLSYEEVVKLMQQFSLNDFISRELIKKRLGEGSRVALHEAQYPAMQGYDSYILDTDLQIGGTDQIFNMQAGRTLIKNWKNKESFILSTEFLMGTDGRKMSKTWGNAIWLEDSPQDMYAKVMSVKDALIPQYFTLATNVTIEEIKQVEEDINAEANPMDIKKKLAFEIVKELYNENEANKAQEHFEKTVQQKELPDQIEEIELRGNGLSIIDVLTQSKLAESKSEAKRLIEQKGVSINNQPVEDPNSIFKGGLVKVGKRKFAKIKLN